MSAFKKLRKSDVIVVPFGANKLWNLSGSAALISSSYNTTFCLGVNRSGSLFNPLTEATSSNGTYPSQVYNTIKQLYYQNFLTSSYQESGSWDGFNQSTLNTIKYFPTSSSAQILVLSIPQELYGSKIMPNTFNFISNTLSFIDDGEGNLFSGSIFLGNIVYPHGLLVFTSGGFNYSTLSSSFNGIISFKNEHIIFENEIRCLVRESELNYSQNPTITSDPSGSLRDFATGSGFTPYVTTVGLYNEQNELLAIGKMAQPVPMSQTTDMTFIIRYDT
jgi:hypothetical protein